MAIKIGITYIFVSVVAINVVGAAVGSFIAYLFVCVAAIYFLYKYSGVSFNLSKAVVKPFISAVACGASAYVFSGLFKKFMPYRVSTLVAILSAGIIYIIFLFLLRSFSENEIKMLPKGEKLSKVLAKLGLLR